MSYEKKLQLLDCSDNPIDLSQPVRVSQCDDPLLLDPSACNGLSQSVNGLLAPAEIRGASAVIHRFTDEDWDGTGILEMAVAGVTYTNTDPCRNQLVNTRVYFGSLWTGVVGFTLDSTFRYYPRAEVVAGVTPPVLPGFVDLYYVVGRYHSHDEAVSQALGAMEFTNIVAPGQSISVAVGGQCLQRSGPAWTGSNNIATYGEYVTMHGVTI